MNNSVHLIMGEQDQFDTLGLFEGNDFENLKMKFITRLAELILEMGCCLVDRSTRCLTYNATAMQHVKVKRRASWCSFDNQVNLPMRLRRSTRNDQQSAFSDFVKTAIASGKSGVENWQSRKKLIKVESAYNSRSFW